MKHLKYICLGAALLLASACTKNFEEINTNPDKSTVSDPQYLFTYVCKEGGGEYGYQSSYGITYLQRWIMHTAAVYGNSTMPPYTLFDQYRIENLWKYYYTNLLLNCMVLEEMAAEDPENVNKLQAARIWRIFNFHRVTDLWGDVPYSDAWRLLDEFNALTINPKYDKQEDIYASMLAELKEAAESFNPSESFYTHDLIFDGDMEAWQRFANSLRLRLAVRSGNQAVVQEIIGEDMLISGMDESATFTYLDNSSWWSPYYELNDYSKNPSNPEAAGTSTPKISELMVRQLMEKGDPRLPVFAKPMEADNMTYRGVPNLMNATLKENQAMGIGLFTTSYIGSYFHDDPDMENTLLGYAEVCFLRAEAAFRGWTAESAQEWYEEGVKASITSYGLSLEDAEVFLAAGGSFDNSLEQIMTQKWVALYLNGYEAFAEYRRTGFPQLKKWDLELDGIKIISYDWVEVPRDYVPGRLPYPSDEVDLNNANYLDAVQQMGGDGYYQKLWWAKKFD